MRCCAAVTTTNCCSRPCRAPPADRSLSRVLGLPLHRIGTIDDLGACRRKAADGRWASLRLAVSDHFSKVEPVVPTRPRFTVNIYSPQPAQKPRTYRCAPQPPSCLPTRPTSSPVVSAAAWCRRAPAPRVRSRPGCSTLIRAPLSDAVFLAFLLAAFLFGIIAAERTGRALGSPIMAPSYVGRNGALLADSHAHPTDTCLARRCIRDLPLLRHRQTAPIRWADQRIKGGLGVMVDDVLAAGYTLLVLALAHRIIA